MKLFDILPTNALNFEPTSQAVAETAYNLGVSAAARFEESDDEMDFNQAQTGFAEFKDYWTNELNRLQNG